MDTPENPPAADQATFPGERLGLPADGVGSIAGLGRRLAAFAVDVVVANALAFLVFGRQGPGGLFVLGVFALEVWLLTAVSGGSFGHHVVGLQVVRLDRRPVGLWRSFIRTVLLCLLIPVMVWDRDQRGLHDLAAQTALVRRR